MAFAVCASLVSRWDGPPVEAQGGDDAFVDSGLQCPRQLGALVFVLTGARQTIF